jgi:peptide deformylase
MPVLKILEYPDPRLRTRAVQIESVDDPIRRLVADMFETMYAAPGVGLAATQVDVHKRVIVMDVSEAKDEPKCLINPEILETNGVLTSDEGCLSVPGVTDEVERAEQIRVSALAQDGEPMEFEASGLLAVCIQHEMDHLEGKLFVDYLSELKRRRIKKKLSKSRKRDAEDQRSSKRVPLI